jgi:hypothetical protein
VMSRIGSKNIASRLATVVALALSLCGDERIPRG